MPDLSLGPVILLWLHCCAIAVVRGWVPPLQLAAPVASWRSSAAEMVFTKYSTPELWNLNCHITPNCLDAITSLKLLRRPWYVHRGSQRQSGFYPPAASGACPPPPHTPQPQGGDPSAVRLPQCSLSSIVDAPQVTKLVTKAKASTCSPCTPLDPMHTALVKACIPTLCPIMVDIINSSLESGMVPYTLKMAWTRPGPG
ncbi:unnamed protein product [Merluccius merluccius]